MGFSPHPYRRQGQECYRCNSVTCGTFLDPRHLRLAKSRQQAAQHTPPVTWESALRNRVAVALLAVAFTPISFAAPKGGGGGSSGTLPLPTRMVMVDANDTAFGTLIRPGTAVGENNLAVIPIRDQLQRVRQVVVGIDFSGLKNTSFGGAKLDYAAPDCLGDAFIRLQDSGGNHQLAMNNIAADGAVIVGDSLWILETPLYVYADSLVRIYLAYSYRTASESCVNYPSGGEAARGSRATLAVPSINAVYPSPYNVKFE